MSHQKSIWYLFADVVSGKIHNRPESFQHVINHLPVTTLRRRERKMWIDGKEMEIKRREGDKMGNSANVWTRLGSKNTNKHCKT